MKVFIIAGEPSGDRLGAALMQGLKTLFPDVTFLGIGGDAMQGEGLSSQFPMSELSIMGIVEIAPKYFHLKRRIRETAEAVLRENPDVLITIDSPDFCLRVAKIVKSGEVEGMTFGHDIPTVHYVAPSVWAWRPKRADKMAAWIDHVLALLPFEPPYMEAAGMGCDFVGHPVVAEPQATPAEIEAFRQTHHIGQAPLMLVLPGSRKGEVTRLADRFGETVARVLREKPDLQVVLPVAQGVSALVHEKIKDWPVQPILIDPKDTLAKRSAFGAANIALAASGTVSLELAASSTPMVIAYDMNWLTKQLLSRMLKIDTVTLVNLVSETRAVPEFLGPDCIPERIAQSLMSVMEHPDVQLDAMSVTMQRLGQGGDAPGLRAAKSVAQVIAQNKNAEGELRRF